MKEKSNYDQFLIKVYKGLCKRNLKNQTMAGIEGFEPSM